MIGKITTKYGDGLYVLFRLIIGALFFMHGIMKFGMLGGNLASTGSLFWFALAISSRAVCSSETMLKILFSFTIRSFSSNSLLTLHITNLPSGRFIFLLKVISIPMADSSKYSTPLKLRIILFVFSSFTSADK